jgi:hypothetical protein
MKKQWQNEIPNRNEFEKLVAASLKLNNFPGISSDEEFLMKLNQRLKRAPNAHTRAAKPKFQNIWATGVWNGVRAMAMGIVLLAGLDIMPPLFVNASMVGAGFVQEKIVQISINQQIRWQQFLMNLENVVQPNK